MKKPKPGTVIPVKVGKRIFKTVIDQDGVQRFIRNTVIWHLWDTQQIDLNRLAEDYDGKHITLDDLLTFYTELGYWVEGLAELSYFQHLKIENPLWKELEMGATIEGDLP